MNAETEIVNDQLNGTEVYNTTMAFLENDERCDVYTVSRKLKEEWENEYLAGLSGVVYDLVFEASLAVVWDDIVDLNEDDFDSAFTDFIEQQDIFDLRDRIELNQSLGDWIVEHEDLVEQEVFDLAESI